MFRKLPTLPVMPVPEYDDRFVLIYAFVAFQIEFGSCMGVVNFHSPPPPVAILLSSQRYVVY